jgi:hypothetical protein
MLLPTPSVLTHPTAVWRYCDTLFIQPAQGSLSHREHSPAPLQKPKAKRFTEKIVIYRENHKKHTNTGLLYVQGSFAMPKWVVYIVTAVQRNEL